MLHNIWYLAHPVAGGNGYSMETNLYLVKPIARALWCAGYKTIMPWYAHVNFLDDTNPVHREDAMEVNRRFLVECEGLILTGHYLSSGMQYEMYAANAAGIKVLNLLGIQPPDIETFLRGAKDATDSVFQLPKHEVPPSRQKDDL